LSVYANDRAIVTQSIVEERISSAARSMIGANARGLIRDPLLAANERGLSLISKLCKSEERKPRCSFSRSRAATCISVIYPLFDREPA